MTSTAKFKSGAFEVIHIAAQVGVYAPLIKPHIYRSENHCSAGTICSVLDANRSY